MMFPGRVFCDVCPFLVPPLKTKGTTASSMVRGVENAGKYTLTYWLVLGGISMARVVKQTKRARAM